MKVEFRILGHSDVLVLEHWGVTRGGVLKKGTMTVETIDKIK